MCPNPLGRDDGQRIEGMTHGFNDEFEPIELANGAQDVCGVGPLPTARFEQPLRSQVGEYFVEEDLLLLASQQADTKLAEAR